MDKWILIRYEGVVSVVYLPLKTFNMPSLTPITPKAGKQEGQETNEQTK